MVTDMCFSLTASLTAAAILFPAGIYSSSYAMRYNRKYLLFSFIPIFFAIQQLSEGIVWYGLHNDNAYLTHHASLAYLFFAYFWWLIYIPLSIVILEEKSSHKRILLLLAIAGFLLGADLYIPIVFNDIPIIAKITNKSIEYITYAPDLMIISYGYLYVTIVVLSLLISSDHKIKMFGLLLFISAAISALWYKIVFTSIWCFFAAILSIYIIYVVRSTRKTNNISLDD